MESNSTTQPAHPERTSAVRRRRKRRTILIAVLVAFASSCSNGSDTRDGHSASGGVIGPKALTDALAKIEDLPKYRQSDWGYSVMDRETGEILAAHNADHYFQPGSTMKTYPVVTALQLYGPDYRFQTPVYRAGEVTGNTLNGNLVLVGSGDLSFGLREQPDGTLYYANSPAVDHSYADLGLPGAVQPPGDPLAGLDQLASKVRASGITQVNGDVVVDDRLFVPYDEFSGGLMSPIWVNENLIDITVAPGSDAGQPTSINWRPMTATYTVDNRTTTVGADETTTLEVTEETPGRLVATGTIAAGIEPRLIVAQVKDPAAFARTAFIEVLQRAGVTVTAAATGPNPTSLLPAKDSYQPADKLGEHVSAPLAEYTKVIMKVSYNRLANLMTCLAAVKTGSTDCEEGLTPSLKTVTDLGLSDTAVYAFDGAGSDVQDRTTPAALATTYQAATKEPYRQALFNSLPIMGKDGNTATLLPDSPAAGKAWLKTGNRIVGTPALQLVLLGNSLAGYIETKSGRQVTVAIAVANVPLSTLEEFMPVTEDQARMAEVIQQNL